MSAVLDKLLGVFVEPAPRAAPVAAAAAVVAAMPAVALMCSPSQAGPVGGAIALELAARVGAPSATLCLWSGDSGQRPLPAAPAGRAARRAADLLGRRGLEGAASGRLARVTLGPDPPLAAAAAIRALAASRGPAVVAIGGTRDAAWDPVLAAVDRALVVTPPGASALGTLARAGVSGPCTSADIAPRPLARLGAACGVAVAPSLRRAIAPLLEGLA